MPQINVKIECNENIHINEFLCDYSGLECNIKLTDVFRPIKMKKNDVEHFRHKHIKTSHLKRFCFKFCIENC